MIHWRSTEKHAEVHSAVAGPLVVQTRGWFGSFGWKRLRTRRIRGHVVGRKVDDTDLCVLRGLQLGAVAARPGTGGWHLGISDGEIDFALTLDRGGGRCKVFARSGKVLVVSRPTRMVDSQQAPDAGACPIPMPCAPTSSMTSILLTEIASSLRPRRVPGSPDLHHGSRWPPPHLACFADASGCGGWRSRVPGLGQTPWERS